MKNRILRSLAVLSALFLLVLIPTGSKAATTTLLSEDFSGEQFPPAGWTANSVYTDGSYSTGWLWSSGGAGASNGSAVAQTYVGYPYSLALGYGYYYMDPPPYSCYAPEYPYVYSGTLPNGDQTPDGGSYLGPLSLTSPSVDVSSYPVTDTQFVDFDVFLPKNYWEYNCVQYYGSDLGLTVTVLDGSTVIKTLNVGGGVDNGDETYLDQSNLGNDDPTGLTDASYWRHYHLALPYTGTSQSITFTVDMEYTSSFSCHAWYTPDVAFDNVAITNVHTDKLTLLGPSTLNFGTVAFAQTAGPLYTKFVNNSIRTIALSNYALVGTNPADFAIAYAPVSVAAGDSDSVGVTYTPQNAGTHSASLTFSTDADIPTDVSISLAGIGVQPRISLPSMPLPMFSHVRVRLGSSAYFTLLVTNTGQGALHISPSTFFSGDFASMYSIVRMPPPIPADQTDSMIIAFSPTVEGLMSANINIVSDASNGTQVLAFKGIGILARLDVDNSYMNATTLNFDSVAVGTNSCMQITLFNPGSDTLAIEKNFLSSSDYDFSITPLTGTDTLIAPGAEKSIQVCFRPLKRGYRTSELRIVTNIPLTYGEPRLDTSQFSVTFIGAGVPTGNFQITGPDAIDTIAVGVADCQTDTLWNTGEADLVVTSLNLSGKDAAEYVPNLPVLPFVLRAGTHQTFTVCGTPKVDNDNFALLTGVANAGEKLDTALLPLDVYATSMNDSVFIGMSIPALTCVGDTINWIPVQVYNTGNVSAQYTASISGTNMADFSLLPPVRSPIVAAGQPATFKVVFAPTMVGQETATVNIVGGAGGSVTLNATAGAATIAGSGTAPTTQVGSSATFMVMDTNKGTCDWTPGIPTVAAPFSYVSGGTTPIAAGGSGTLTFSFAPTSAGTVSQSVSFPNSTGVSIPGAAVTVTGATQSESVAEVSSLSGYSLEQNYPNPFAGKTSVSLTLPESGMVRLVIVDATGAVVETVLDQQMGVGTFQVTLDASGLASGTYYYQMMAGNVILTRHMIIQK